MSLEKARLLSLELANELQQLQPPGPIDGTNYYAAKALARIILEHVRAAGRGYNHDWVREFQHVVGIAPDGLYGPETVKALQVCGQVNPPAPLYEGKAT